MNLNLNKQKQKHHKGNDNIVASYTALPACNQEIPPSIKLCYKYALHGLDFEPMPHTSHHFGIDIYLKSYK